MMTSGYRLDKLARAARVPPNPACLDLKLRLVYDLGRNNRPRIAPRRAHSPSCTKVAEPGFMLNALVPLILVGWGFAVFGFFAISRSTTAVSAAFVAGWLFLPVYSIEMYGFPDYSKITATSLAVFAAAFMFDFEKIVRVRLGAWDLPMLFWCTCPIPSSLLNGLGLYDGLSRTLYHLIEWGVPYFLGRCFYTTPRNVFMLLKVIFIGGLVYVPFCLIEVRFSPQLSTWIYGIFPHSFTQHMRDGGFRPIVFMHHGLMVGMWMSVSTLMGYYLWRFGGLRQIAGFPASLLFGLCFVTTILVKSLGAIVLLVLGIGVLELCFRHRRVVLLALVVAISPAYMFLRGAGELKEPLFTISQRMSSEERSGSFKFRMDMEDFLLERAFERPLLGWGGHGRNIPIGENGQPIVTDGQWIIVFGLYGLIGLVAFTAVFLAPATRLIARIGSREWRGGETGLYVGASMIGLLYVVDNLLNAMINPVFLLAIGAAVSLPASIGRAPRGARRQIVPLSATR